MSAHFSGVYNRVRLVWRVRIAGQIKSIILPVSFYFPCIQSDKRRIVRHIRECKVLRIWVDYSMELLEVMKRHHHCSAWKIVDCNNHVNDALDINDQCLSIINRGVRTTITLNNLLVFKQNILQRCFGCSQFYLSIDVGCKIYYFEISARHFQRIKFSCGFVPLCCFPQVFESTSARTN